MITAGVRALIVATGLVGERVWADVAPENATRPYVTVADLIAMSPALSGDGRTLWLARTLQVSVWERARDEDPDVKRGIYAALDGATVPGDAGVVHLTVTDAARLPEEVTNIVQTAMTLETKHPRDAF